MRMRKWVRSWVVQVGVAGAAVAVVLTAPFASPNPASAKVVIADLSMANPNVYLEVGYAWGRNRPTVLLVRDVKELRFDVASYRCIVYRSIRELESLLSRELERLG